MTDNGCELKMWLSGISEDDIKTCDVHLVGSCNAYSEDGIHTFTAL